MMIYNTRALILASVLTAVGGGLAIADEDKGGLIPGEISGSVTLTSDYRFRGISQTDKNPAIQGSLEYSIDTGFYGITPYAGFWASNVDFQDGDQATIELDVLFGLRGDVGDTGVSWDLGGIGYFYPGANSNRDYDYWELALGLGYEPMEIVSLNAGYYYSPDFFGSTGDAHYFLAGVTVTPPINIHEDIGLSFFGTLGRQLVEDLKDYTDWSLGVTLSYKFVDLTVAYVDTNLTQRDLDGTSLGNAGVVASIGASF